MKKINYKGRCEKRKVSKCEDICRTYSKIQSAMVDILENDNDVASFECNVRLIGVAEDLYSTDFVIKISQQYPVCQPIFVSSSPVVSFVTLKECGHRIRMPASPRLGIRFSLRHVENEATRVASGRCDHINKQLFAEYR